MVFSIHGTGITQKAKEYNADLWAYLKEELGHRIEGDRGMRPVVGAMEGTHADVAPALRPGLGGHREARRIGCGIGAEAHELYRSLGERLHRDVTLEAGLREVDLSREADRRIDGIELPDRPAVGAALVAGAKENVTPVIHRIPPFKAGSPKRWGVDDQQGVKWVLGSKWLQPLMLPRSGFPRIMPLQMLHIDDVALIGLPFETTVVAGRRVAEAVGEALPDGPRAVVCSVVNDYWGYVTTAEEYSRQFYEGGHTLYGPDTQAFVASQVKRLAADASGRPSFADVVPERRWNLHRRHFLPAAETTAVSRRFERRARFHDPTATVDGCWEQTWVDGHPGTLRWHDPIVRVESSDDDGATWQPATQGGQRIDDQGWALAVTHLGPLAEGEVGGADVVHRYRVRWYDPVMRFGRRHRFVLLANGDRPEVSGDPFD